MRPGKLPTKPGLSTKSELSAKTLLSAIALCALGLLLTLPVFDRVLFEHDDGLIGLMAQLTRNGMRSHVDFFDPYSGLLNLWHAAFFSVLGESLRTPRIAALCAFLLTIPIVFGLSLRLFDYAKSLLVSATWIVWSLPQYISSLPSWYNVFLAFATIATLAVYTERRSYWQLVAAGFITALSISVKVIGLYLLAGCLLYLVYDSQDTVRPGPRAVRRVSLFAIALALGGLLVAAGSVLLLKRHLNATYVVFFIVPLLCPWLVLFMRELEVDRPFTARCRELFLERIAPYFVGVGAVLVAWVVRYPELTELQKVYEGIFILPHRRAEFVTRPLPPLPLTLYTLIALIALITSRRWPERLKTVFCYSIWSILATVALSRVVAPEQGMAASSTWWGCGTNLLVALAPLFLVAEALKLTSTTLNGASGLRFLIVSVASYFQLVMYPFSTHIYFAYSAPLLLFVSASLLKDGVDLSRTTFNLVMAQWIFIGIGWVGLIYYPDLSRRSAFLDTPRGQVKFTPEQTRALTRIVAEVERLVPPHQPIYAGPQAPEVLFLTDREHVGRFVIEELQSGGSAAAGLLETLRASAVEVAVVKYGVDERSPDSLHRAIEPGLKELYPNEENLVTYSLWTRSAPLEGMR